MNILIIIREDNGTRRYSFDGKKITGFEFGSQILTDNEEVELIETIELFNKELNEMPDE